MIPKTESNFGIRTRNRAIAVAGQNHVMLFTFGILMLLIGMLGLALPAQGAAPLNQWWNSSYLYRYPEGWAYPSLAEVRLRDSNNGAVAAFMSAGMTEPEGQRVLDQALFERIFKRDLRTLGRAISYAKQELVANSVALGETGKTFLLFGDPTMKLKVPLPKAPTAPTGQVSGNSVTLT